MQSCGESEEEEEGGTREKEHPRQDEANRSGR